MQSLILIVDWIWNLLRDTCMGMDLEEITEGARCSPRVANPFCRGQNFRRSQGESCVLPAAFVFIPSLLRLLSSFTRLGAKILEIDKGNWIAAALQKSLRSWAPEWIRWGFSPHSLSSYHVLSLSRRKAVIEGLSRTPLIDYSDVEKVSSSHEY